MQKRKLLKIVLLLGDISLMYAALFLALFFRNKNLVCQFSGFFYNFLILYAVWIFIIFVLSLYDLNFFRKTADFFFNLIIFSISAFFTGVAYFYFYQGLGLTPKTILLLNVLIFDVLFFFWRYLVNLFLEAREFKEKAIIVGFHERLNEIFPQIRRIYEIAAVFCPPYINEQKKCLFVSPDSKNVSEISDLKNIVSEKKVTSVIFALDFYSNRDLVKKIFSALPLTLNYIGIDDLYESITKKVSLEYLDEIWFLEKVSKPENIFQKSIKRMLDIVFSIIGLLLFIIFLPFVAIAIKMDSPGHVFYSQKRVGKNGRIIVIHKFRTMKEHPDEGKEVWREKDSNNITRVGGFLRRAHIDELPQSWSIFKGDLSVVGPRPEWVELVKKFEEEIPFYKQRYLVKPGLIGWAQINFPASRSVQEAGQKFEYDLYYIKNQSLLLDLEIILKTAKLFFW